MDGLVDQTYSKRYNKLLSIVFFTTIFSGALRKWIFIEGGIVGNIIQLLQLVIPLIVYFSKSGFKQAWSNNLFAFFMLILVVEALNPLNLTLYHGLFGIIVHIGFFFLIFHYLANRESIHLEPILKVIVFICLGEVVLAFIQYQLPSTHFINRYADISRLGSKSIATVGGAVRVTGTFSFIGGFTALLIFNSLLAWALVRISFNFKLTSLLIAGNLVAALMSGSRGAMLNVVLIYVLMFLFEFSGAKMGELIKSTIIPIVAIVLISLATGGIGIEDKVVTAYDNFEDRVTSNLESGETSNRVTGEFDKVVGFDGEYPITGIGLGATYQGATALFGTSPLVWQYGYVEGEPERIILEGGFILFLVRIILIASFLYIININFISKAIFFFFLAYQVPIAFNIYNCIFFALGLILLDNAALIKQRKDSGVALVGV